MKPLGEVDEFAYVIGWWRDKEKLRRRAQVSSGGDDAWYYEQFSASVDRQKLNENTMG